MTSHTRTLRTGLVIAGAYADKVRRTLFAQTRDLVKSGEITSQEVARAAGELNRILYEILVDRLKTEKGDVVRVAVDYRVEEGRIIWELEKLQVQLWRSVPQAEVDRVVSDVKSIAKRLVAEAIAFEAEKAIELASGDIVYLVRYKGRDVGALIATPVNEAKAIVRGAVLEPTPLVLRRTAMDYTGSLDDFMKTNISQLLARATNVEYREADKILREIKALVRAELEEAPEAEEAEEE
ncbi:MAG: DUF2258 domain-containing protein [Acidilobaceae archaeon]